MYIAITDGYFAYSFSGLALYFVVSILSALRSMPARKLDFSNLFPKKSWKKELRDKRNDDGTKYTLEVSHDRGKPLNGLDQLGLPRMPYR